MNKKELIDAVAEKVGATKKDTAAILDTAFDCITKTMKKDEPVAIFGFGTFKVAARAARTGVNPKTKAKIKIQARKSPSFHASKTLKDAVNGK